jgi:hypothetical protein
MPKFVLFWKGTLMRLATGFCVALARAAVSSAAAAGLAAAWASSGAKLTAAFCAAREAVYSKSAVHRSVQRRGFVMTIPLL